MGCGSIVVIFSYFCTLMIGLLTRLNQVGPCRYLICGGLERVDFAFDVLNQFEPSQCYLL